MIRNWIARMAVTAAAVAAVAAVAPTSPAAASTCGTPYCGGIITNQSSRALFVSNNWCWSNTSTYYGSTLPCAPSWNDHAYSSYFLLTSGDTTLNYSYYYDTDSFRVDANCIVDVYDGFEDLTFDNRGSGTPLWEKITSIQRFTITNIIC